MSDATPAPAEKSDSLFDRVIATTPVVLTIIATLFAGLSSTEMNLAMYWRSASAEDQGKATSQWGLAGFKRDRSLIMQTQARTLHGLSDESAPKFPASESAETKLAFEWLAGKGPPTPRLPEPGEPIRAVQQAIRDRLPESDVLSRASLVPRPDIDQAIRDLQKVDDEFDRLTAPVLKAADAFEQTLTEKKDKPHLLAVQSLRAELDRRRYLIEAKLNQDLGHLYEVRVRMSSAEAERHRTKSKNFFYVMLLAQAGVTVASVALAQRKKSVFWLMASVAGVIAILLGTYVYLAI